MIAQITDHIDAAKRRLLQQYKDSPRLASLTEILFGQQVQDLEYAAYEFYGRLDIDNAEGVQLDRIGSVVGLTRIGWEDDLYWILLKAKIGKNVSHGTVEDVINVWRLIAQADRVQIIETHPAQIDLYSDTPIAGDLSEFVRNLMQKVVAAGVRVDFLAIIFSPTNAFGFDPDDPNVLGFGDLNDPGVGGEFAYIQLTQ